MTLPAIQLLSHAALLLPGKPPLALAAVDALLLARLLLDGPQSPAALADWLWPDAGTSRALSHLRQRRYRLKNLAGTPVVEGVSPLQVASGITHDLLNFEAGLRANHNHGSGDLLGALQVPAHEEQAAWLQQRRAWWAAVKVAALQACLRALLEPRCPTQQALDQALALAQRWVQEQPLNEAAWRSLMQLHHQRGEAALALQAYEDCKGLLLQQQRTTPSAETERLSQLLRSAARPVAAPIQAVPAALLRPPVLVERQVLWQQTCNALDRCQPVLLQGDAGVGKSRLLGDLLQARGRGLLVTAVAGDHVLAYALVSRLVSQAVPRLGWPPEPETQRQLARVTSAAPQHTAVELDSFSALRLQRSLTAALLHWHRAASPHSEALDLLALDDLHHADQASLDLLLPVLAETAQQGLCWLLAARPAAVAAAAAMPQGLADGGTTATGARVTSADSAGALDAIDGLQRLALQPLSQKGVLQLLQTLDLPLADPSAWAAGLSQRTGGNPLYVLQTLSTALDTQAQQQAQSSSLTANSAGYGVPSPPSTTAALVWAPADWPLPAPLLAQLAQRLEHLSPAARALVRLAAVAGGDFDLRLAALVLKQTPLQLADPWLELQTAHIMGEEGFAHDLIFDAAKSWTPTAIAKLLHEQLAGTLQQLNKPAAKVAPHWDAAACWPQAAQAHEQAAADAQRLGVGLDELRGYQEAARCHRLAGDSGRAFGCEVLALRLMIASSMLGAEVLQRCQALLQVAVGNGQRAQALELLAHHHNEQFRPEQGLLLAEQALKLAQAAGAETTVLLAAQQLGYALSRLGRAQEAVAVLQPLQARAAALLPQPRLAWRATLALVLGYAEQWQPSLAVCEEVIVDAQALQQWQAAAEAWGQKGVALGYLGQLKLSHAATETALQISQRNGAPEAALLVDRASAAANLRDLGRFADYLQVAESLPQALRDHGNPFWAQNAENDLAVAWVWLGRPERALPLLDAAAADLSPLAQAMRWRTRARLAHSLGLRLAGYTPQQMALQALQCLQGQQVPEMLRLSTGLAVALTGDTAAGLAFADEAESQGHARNNVMLVLAAQVTQLDLALRARQQPRAAEVAQRLLQAWPVDALPAGPYAPEVGWLCHCALKDQAPGPAGDVLLQSASWIRQRLQHDVPATYRVSFTQRNPVNAAVLLAFSKVQDHG